MTQPPKDAWRLLSPQLTDKRRARLLHSASHRTAHLRLVIQDIHHPHNVSACLRSADAFGIQNVDVVAKNEKFAPSTVAKGVGGWLNITKFESVTACATELKQQGFLIAAGFPPAQADCALAEVPVSKPLAIVFSNEHAGLDPDWLEYLDYRFTIPMVGFVESLNISVSCAITLNNLRERALLSLKKEQFCFDERSQIEVLNGWVTDHFPAAREQLERLRADQ